MTASHFAPFASLIELNAEPTHELAPAFDLVCIELGEFVARGRACFESERLDPTGKAGGLHDLHQLAIEPVENRLRRSGRSVEAGPERTDELGPPQLHRRGRVWKHLQAPVAHDRERPQLAGRDEG